MGHVVVCQIVDKESVAMTGYIIESVVAFSNVVSAHAVYRRFHTIHQVVLPFITLSRKNPECASGITHEDSIIRGVHDMTSVDLKVPDWSE